jgi:hypothetical protein
MSIWKMAKGMTQKRAIIATIMDDLANHTLD